MISNYGGVNDTLFSVKGHFLYESTTDCASERRIIPRSILCLFTVTLPLLIIEL